jgi:predicted DNA-binding ribbon-helix-helix protein
VALEPEFWAVLESEALREHKSLASLVAEIDSRRVMHPLASALRLHVLAMVRKD